MSEQAAEPFTYSDGEALELGIVRLLKEAEDLGSGTRIAPEQQRRHWALRYHLAPERAQLLSHLDFSDLRVLELGAGMGAVSRFLAEHSSELVAVEGSERRAEGIRQRLRDLQDWSVAVDRLESYDSALPFDAVCMVGVLEYASSIVEVPQGFAGDAFDYVLLRAARHLAPGGVLLVAIENPFGIKYWSGAAEDHTDDLFSGIAGYATGAGPRTFCWPELSQRLSKAGLGCQSLYLPFPDYKLPRTVIRSSLAEQESDLVVDLACHRPFSGRGQERSHLFPDLLAMEHLSRAGLLTQFANSFLVLASAGSDSKTLEHLQGGTEGDQVQAWHYAPERRQPAVTVFLKGGAQGELRVEKRLLSAPAAPADAVEPAAIRWQGAREPLQRGVRPRWRLLRQLYFGQENAFLDELLAFVRWVLAEHGHRTEAEGREAESGSVSIAGQVIDAVYSNALAKEEGGYLLFDQEWVWHEPFPATWLVLRNVLALDSDRPWLNKDFSFANLQELYELLCARLDLQPRLSADLELEARLESSVLLEDEEVLRQDLQHLLEQPFQHSLLPPRRPDFLQLWLRDAEQVAARTDEMERTIAAQAEAVHWHEQTIASHEEGMAWLKATMEYHERTSEERQAQLSAREEELSASHQELEQLRGEEESLRERLQAESAEVEALRQLLGSRRHRSVESLWGVLQRVRRTKVGRLLGRWAG